MSHATIDYPPEREDEDLQMQEPEPNLQDLEARRKALSIFAVEETRELAKDFRRVQFEDRHELRRAFADVPRQVVGRVSLV